MKNTIQKLQEWYSEQCDSFWEHSYGITIDTLDNPGWHVSIDLEGTNLEDKEFKEIQIEYDHSSNWLICRRLDKKFDGAGGPMQLDNILNIFLSWASEK